MRRLVSLAIVLVFCFSRLTSAAQTTVYATANRDGQINAASNGGENGACGSFDFVADYGGLTATTGYWDFNDGEGEVWTFSRASFGFSMTGVTGVPDSAWVFLKVSSVDNTCSDDPNVGIYVGDCDTLGIGGVNHCTATLAVADSAQPTGLIRQWAMSEVPIVGDILSWKVPAESLTVGSGHSYDIRIATTVHEATGICGCSASEGTTVGSFITFYTVENTVQANRPYIIVYTHAGSSPPATTAIQYFPDEEEQ
jgi:hypothetical protein